jgi:hypothetical protein
MRKAAVVMVSINVGLLTENDASLNARLETATSHYLFRTEKNRWTFLLHYNPPET